MNGEDLRPTPLEHRKAKLEKLLARSDGIRFSEHLDGDGATIFAHACKLGLEGIVSKRRDLSYRSGRCKAWVKVKNPASPGRPTDRGWDVVKGMSAFGQAVGAIVRAFDPSATSAAEFAVMHKPRRD